MLFGGPFAGTLFDNFGPRWILLAGTFLHVFGLMMTSISHTYYQILLSQAVCSAIGASFVFYPAFSSVSTWFMKKRGAAIGLVTAGSSLGGVIFPVMVIRLLPPLGFGWTLRICAFLILALLIFANLTIQSRIRPSKRPFKLMAFVSPLGEPTFAVFAAAAFFFYWGMFIPITFIVIEAQSHGMSPGLANYLVSILNGASIIGRTVPNALADRTGFFNMMILMAILNAIVVLALWLPATGNAPIILFAALFGITSGAGIGLVPALCAKLSPIKDIGVRTGSAFAVASLAALTGSPIGGAIVGAQHGSYQGAILFSGVSFFVATALFVVARLSHSREWRA